MPLEHRLHARCGCASAAELASFAARPFASPSSTRHFERDRPFAIDRLVLDILLELPTKSLRAEAKLELRRVDPDATAVLLDAVGFTIDRVDVDGHAVAGTIPAP